MSFWAWLGILVVVGIILRGLRTITPIVDYVGYGLILAGFIYTWIRDGFWLGLLSGFIGAIAICLLFGLGGETEVRNDGKKYSLTCDKCGYDDLEIISKDGNYVVTKCKRCGDVIGHILQ